MNKNKLKSILLMALFFGMVFCSIPDGSLTNFAEDPQTNESQDIFTAPKTIDDSIIESPATRSVIDYDRWYLSESIKTDIEFNKQPIDYTFLSYAHYPSESSFSTTISHLTYGLYEGLEDDSAVIAFKGRSSGSEPIGSSEGFDLTTRIYCGGAGDIHYDFRGLWYSDTPVPATSWITNWETGTFAVTSSMLDSLGYLFLVFRLEMANTGNFLAVRLYYFSEAGLTQIAAEALVSCTSTTFWLSAIQVDYIYFLRDTITNDAKSTYKYNSPTTKTHSVNPLGITFAKEQNIYYDETRWTYSSITPTASVTDTGGVLTINSPTEIDYEILFISNCSNHLAIKDVSTYHFTDVGFEGSTDIYVNWASNPFETFETSTEQSFAGYSSLKTVQNSGTYGISYTLLANDYYYVSCWAYIDSIAGGAETVAIAWWDGTAWNYESFDDTIIDRWQNLQFYMQIIGDDNERNFQFYVSATTATVYFDYESLLFQTSTTIKTTQSSEYQIESTLISWDGYKNPLLEGQQTLNTTLLERSSQTVEYTTNLTSTTGIFELNYDQALEQKEYEIWAYSYSSGEFNNCSFYFTPSYPSETDYAETVQSDSIDWTEGDDEGYSCYTGAIMTDTTEKGYLKLEYSSGTSDWTSFRLLNDKDTSLDYYPDGLIYANGFIHFYTTFAGTFRISRYTEAFVSYMTDISFNSGWKEINMNLNQNWRDYVHEKSFYIQIQNTEHNYQAGDIIQIDWINFVHVDSPVLIETDTNFYLSSVDNDYSYDVYLDENYLGVHTDLQTILKNNTVGNHNLTYVLFSAGEERAYLSSTYEYLYTIDSASFSVSVENFYLSDLYVNTYVTSNRDGSYYVYKDNAPDDSGTLSAIGTTISTSRDLTVGVTIAYAIKFVNDTSTIWFNTTYSNPSQDFFITDYRINTTAPNIIITWDTSKNTIDSLTAIEDEITKVTDDPTSTTSWTKSTETGTHYVTLIFSATNFDDIIYSFTYTVAAIEEFQVDVENVFPSDDYLSIYCTSNYNYSYNAYTNGTPSGSGNGLSVGTFIIIPKQTTAGIFNLTVAFVYGAETVLFMTWYSNLIPPPEPNTDIYREQSEGFFNISFITNLDTFWIDIYHDNVLIYDDSTSTAFSIVKDTLIGWHNVSLILIYNCSTDAEGYPVAEYNETITYPLFWYETVLFYDCKIRYTERIYGIAVPEIEVDDVLTYLDGVLIDTLNATSVIQDHSNYSYILNDRIWIHNSARNHRLVVRDLFDNLIYNVSIDIGIIYSMTIELPLEKLYVSNLDDDDRLIKIRPYLSGLDWDVDADDLITMILGQYESKSYWVIDATYESRIYKKVESVSDGVTLWYWVHDPDVEPPPERVPFSITIPLVTDDDDDDGEKTWWDKIVDFFVQYWFYIALVLLLIVLLISYNAIGNAIVKKLEKTIRKGKKPSLFAETFLQLLWSSKYDRLVGYKRGKQK